MTEFHYQMLHGRICDVLCHFVPYVQFKKREKHPGRSVTKHNTSMGVFHVFKIVPKIPNRVTHHT